MTYIEAGRMARNTARRTPAERGYRGRAHDSEDELPDPSALNGAGSGETTRAPG